ncbi:unnamed protein product [Diamesa serratosioi]
MERISNFGRENLSTSFFGESAFELEASQRSINKVTTEQQSGLNMDVINNLLNQIKLEQHQEQEDDSTNILALISSSFSSGFGDSINTSQLINEDKMRDHLFVASTPFSIMKKMKQVKNIIDHENVSQYIKEDGNKSLALEFNGASPICNKSAHKKYKLIGRKLCLNELEESFSQSGLLSRFNNK